MTASIPARAEWPQRVCDKCWVQLAGSAPVLSQTAEEQKSEDADPSSPSTPSTPPSPRSSDPSNLARRRPRVVHFGSTHEIPAAVAVEAKDDLSSSSSFSPSPSSPPEPVYSEAAVYSSPSPLSSFAFPGGGEGPAVLSPTDLFNRLAALSSLLLLDIRPASSYRASHVPRSVSFPVSLDDVRTRTPLQALEERLPALERRQLRMRQRSHIVVIGDGEDGDVDELQRLGYVCSLLMQPVKHSSLAVLTPGYAIFHHLYPFLSCEYPPTAGTPASTSDASAASVSAPLPPHVHLPAFPSYPSEVLPSFLFIGSHTDAANLAHLRHLRVTHIVNVTEDIPCHFPQHFTYVHVPIADAPDSRLLALLPDLVSTLTALASAPASPTPRVLIHCHQGVSRSCAVTLALLVRLQHVTLHAAFAFLRRRRRQVMPNVGFWKQLAQWERREADAQDGLREADERGVGGSLVGGHSDWPGTVEQCVDLSALQAEYDDLMHRKAAVREVDEENKEASTDGRGEDGSVDSSGDEEDADSVVRTTDGAEAESNDDSVVILPAAKSTPQIEQHRAGDVDEDLDDDVVYAE